MEVQNKVEANTKNKVEVQKNQLSEEEEEEEQVKEQFNIIERSATKILTKVSDKYAPKLRQELGVLKSVIISKEIFRAALIGRKGSGKATFINALINNNVRTENSFENEMMWESVPGTKWEVVDVSGYENGNQDNRENTNSVFESFKDTIEATEKWPDVVFFLMKASDVESDIKPDLLFLEQISKYLNKPRPKNKEPHIPVFVVLTHIDTLAPETVVPHPGFYKNKEIAQKRRNISKVVSNFQNSFHKLMKQSNFKVNGVYPVCCYVKWEEYDQNPSHGFAQKTDLRYGLEELCKDVLDSLRNQVKFNFANSLYFSHTKEKMARIIIASFSTVSSIIAASPIPFSDFALVTSIRALMLYIIKGLSPPKHKTLTWGGFFVSCGVVLGVSYAARATLRQIIKFVPVAGPAVSVGMAFSGTWMLGELGILYFIKGVNRLDRKSRRKEKERMKKVMEEKGL